MMDCEQESMEHQEDPQVLHTITALLEFGASKQQLKLKDPTFTGTVIDVEKALGAIGKDVSILCPGKSPTGSKEVFVLQVWSDRWKSYVNMSQDDTVKDGDHLTVSQVSQPEVSVYMYIYARNELASLAHYTVPSVYTPAYNAVAFAHVICIDVLLTSWKWSFT